MAISSNEVKRVISNHQRSGSFIKIDGVETFVVDQGVGPAVLCLHGVPTSSFLYRKILSGLQAQGFRAIAFDYPGLGLSARPEAFDYSFRGLTEFAHQAVKSLGLASFHLVVHDIGGPIGFALAAEIRDRIESLTILNTWIEVDQFRKPLPMRPFGWPGVGRLQLKVVNYSTWYLMFKSMGVHDMTGITTEEVYAYVDLLKRCDGGDAFLKIMRGFDHSVEFKRRCYKGAVDVPYPVQAIWGVNDPGLKVERYGTEIERVVRPGRFFRLPGKHLLQEDCWRAIVEKVAALGKHSGH